MVRTAEYFEKALANPAGPAGAIPFGNRRNRCAATPEEAQEVIENDSLELKPQLIAGEERIPNVGVSPSGHNWSAIGVGDALSEWRVFQALSGSRRLRLCPEKPRAGETIRQSGSVPCEVRIPRSSLFERNRLAKQKPMNR